MSTCSPLVAPEQTGPNPLSLAPATGHQPRYVLGSTNLPQGHGNLGLQSETTIPSKNTGEKSLGTHQDGHLDSLPCGPRLAGALKSRLLGCPSP